MSFKLLDEDDPSLWYWRHWNSEINADAGKLFQRFLTQSIEDRSAPEFAALSESLVNLIDDPGTESITIGRGEAVILKNLLSVAEAGMDARIRAIHAYDEAAQLDRERTTPRSRPDHYARLYAEEMGIGRHRGPGTHGDRSALTLMCTYVNCLCALSMDTGEPKDASPAQLDEAVRQTREKLERASEYATLVALEKAVDNKFVARSWPRRYRDYLPTPGDVPFPSRPQNR